MEERESSDDDDVEEAFENVRTAFLKMTSSIINKSNVTKVNISHTRCSYFL